MPSTARGLPERLGNEVRSLRIPGGETVRGQSQSRNIIQRPGVEAQNRVILTRDRPRGPAASRALFLQADLQEPQCPRVTEGRQRHLPRQIRESPMNRLRLPWHAARRSPPVTRKHRGPAEADHLRGTLHHVQATGSKPGKPLTGIRQDPRGRRE